MNYVTAGLSVASWLFGGTSQGRSGVELKALPVCALFALIPALPSETRLGLSDGVVKVQLVKGSVTIPGTHKKITNLSVERTWNGDSKDDATLFNEAVMKIVNESGGDPLTQKLLLKTAEGLKTYSSNYPKNSLAFATLNNLAQLILKELNDPDKGKASPMEDDRMEGLVDMIEHVYQRVDQKLPYTPELSASLAYINGLQMNEEDLLRQNQQVVVPT